MRDEESPSAAGQGRRLTAGGGDFRESATEIYRETVNFTAARVKRRCKRPPIPGRPGMTCKPRPAQDNERQTAARRLSNYIARTAWQPAVQIDVHPRQNSAYRSVSFL